MYISGHKHVLREVLQHMPVPYKSNLKKGLMYIDLPCGKYKFISKNHVVMNKKRVCKIYHLYKILSETNGFKEIFQSHRGMLAYLHSMTYDQHQTVKHIRDKIVTHILVFAYLAASTYNNEKGDAFWIGCILHIVMDSYSQSHTIRLLHKPTKIPSYIPLSPSDKAKIYLEEKVFPLITATTSKELIHKLIKLKPSMKSYVAYKKKHIFRAYKRYVFHTRLQKLISKRYTLPEIKHDTHQSYDIVNFQYYKTQSVLYHAKYDQLSKLKKYPEMYDRMIQDCISIVKMYDRYLSNHNRSYFIHSLHQYVLNNTFKISEENLKHRTGLQYIS